MYADRNYIDKLMGRQSLLGNPMKAACYLGPLFILCRMGIRSHF